MKAHAMLNMLASRYATGEGPVRRQLDAQTLLKMAPNLDEESSRIYLERFVSKWRVDLTEVDGGRQEYDRAVDGVQRNTTRHTGLIRRRPMTDLERKVQEELTLDAPGAPPVLAGQDPATTTPLQPVTITFEDANGEVHTL